MLQERTAIPIYEAITKVLDTYVQLPSEKITLQQSTGRSLAFDLIANQDVPAFNRSLYDGYAIKAENTNNAAPENPVILEVVGEIGAGQLFTEKVGNYQAVRIMTGAQVPSDCNAVVMLEHVKDMSTEMKTITIDRTIPIGDRVFHKGQEIREGAILVKRGEMITPGIIGLLATFGYGEIEVIKKPKIGILATGNELLDVHDPLSPGKIRNSNAYMLFSQVIGAGGEAIYLGKLEDNIEQSIQAIKNVLPELDALITTGGVSVGDFDYLPEIYKQLGATVLFNKINMRPGSVTTVAKLGSKMLFGLSGNPSASFIGFELFVRPTIRRFLGNSNLHLLSCKGILMDDELRSTDFTQLIRAKYFLRDTNLFVTSNGLNMSSSISSIAGAEALMILDPEKRTYRKGDEVQILLLSENKGQQESVFSQIKL
ncbi:molybdopterin molybdenumtransferase [Lysinibacillus sp. PLM2]|nr:molybdopterin molybdenumtransferase [Lysinibacillus sp. PLM2]